MVTARLVDYLAAKVHWLSGPLLVVATVMEQEKCCSANQPNVVIHSIDDASTSVDLSCFYLLEI
jgi:hypothetical protein